MTTVSKEKLSQAAQIMKLPQRKPAAPGEAPKASEAAPVAETAPVMEATIAAAAEAVEAKTPCPEPRIRVMDLNWRRRPMSVKGDLEADTPIGRIVITMALLPSKTPCTLQMPTMGEHSFRPIPCENIGQAQATARSEIEALVRRLTVMDIEPATADAS